MQSFILTNIGKLLTCSGQIQDNADKALGAQTNCALVIKDGKFSWFGNSNQIPQDYQNFKQTDAEQKLVMPGFVDSHTHIVFGGSRELEYEKRCSGISYAEIAAKGGGIKYTVEQTRAASFEQLYNSALAKAQRMLKFGVTTLEIKSGYGLDLETEIKQLEVIKKLRETTPLRIIATYLGAHEFPKEKTQAEYIDFLCKEAIPQIAKNKLAEYCDIFCETGVFSVEQSRQILTCAKEHGFKLKLHAEELTCIGGAELAAELKATSADHLVHISESGINKMIAAGVVFCLLPATTFFLGKKQYAPAKDIINKGGILALATDCNPGSCTLENIQLLTTLACSQLGISPQQALWAITQGGALALDLADNAGQIKIGKQADFVIIDAKNEQQIPYSFGRNLVEKVFINGQMVSHEKNS